MAETTEFSQWLKMYMKREGLRVEQVAVRAEVSAKTVWDWLRDKQPKNPTQAKALRLTRAGDPTMSPGKPIQIEVADATADVNRIAARYGFDSPEWQHVREVIRNTRGEVYIVNAPPSRDK